MKRVLVNTTLVLLLALCGLASSQSLNDLWRASFQDCNGVPCPLMQQSFAASGPWTGPQSLNDLWRASFQDCGGTPCITTTLDGGGGYPTFTEATRPDPCEPATIIEVTDATEDRCALQRCNATGDGWGCIGGSGDNPEPPSLPGITTDVETNSVTSIKPNVFPTSSDLTIFNHWQVPVTVGSSGHTVTLPLLSEAQACLLHIFIADDGAGTLTLAPSGSDLILTNNTPLTVTGQFNGFHVECSDGFWYVETVADLDIVPTGAVWGDFIFVGDDSGTPILKKLTCAAGEYMRSAGPGADPTCYTPVGAFMWSLSAGSNITCTNPGPSTFYTGPVTNGASGTEATHSMETPAGGTAYGLYVKIPNAVPAGETVITTFRVNGVDTAITCTAAAAATECEDRTHTATVATGDLVSWKITCGGGTTAVSVHRLLMGLR